MKTGTTKGKVLRWAKATVSIGDQSFEVVGVEAKMRPDIKQAKQALSIAAEEDKFRKSLLRELNRETNSHKRGHGFEREVSAVLDSIKDTLIEWNIAYGDSALNPVRVFSKASSEEQLRVRIDDKLSRLARGSDAGEDTIKDLIGYLVLLRIAQKRGAK